MGELRDCVRSKGTKTLCSGFSNCCTFDYCVILAAIIFSNCKLSTEELNDTIHVQINMSSILFVFNTLFVHIVTSKQEKEAGNEKNT